jgi:SnoaL-like domain
MISTTSELVPLHEPSMRVVTKLLEALMAANVDAVDSSFHDAITYAGPLYADIRKEQVVQGWELMLSRISELKIDHQFLYADERKAQITWRAQYLVGARRVTFEGMSTFSLWDDKIVRQVDEWKFGPWARKHFGLKGWLFAWNASFERHCQDWALDGLHRGAQSRR